MKSPSLRDVSVDHPSLPDSYRTVSFVIRPVSLGIHLVMIAHKVAQYGDRFLIVQLSGLLCKFPPEGRPTRLFHLLLTADLSWYDALSEVIHPNSPTVRF